ncbi:MAG TPA: hypothetical protein DEQ09_11275 [Bacteroidales bacterium]|nr:hypothetical protein [Bacteroidales bacterium]
MLAHTEIHTHAEVLSIYQNINRYFNYLMYVTLLVFILGILTYGQSFSFREHALSHFGRIHTQDGSPNTLSVFIYGTGMLISSAICFKLSRLSEENISHNLLRITAVGYILLITPCDVVNTIQSIGGALVIGSLWLLAVIEFHQLLNYTHRKRIYLYHLLLQGTMLPYAFLYAFGSSLCPMVQKFAFAGLMISLKLMMLEEKKGVVGEGG